MRNRETLLAALSLPADQFTVANQEHTSAVAIVDRETAGTGGLNPDTRIARTDALSTSLPQVALGVMTADCVPILLADPCTRAVAAVHAGWRGSAAGIVANTVHSMKTHFGARPRDILAFLGPHIGACCYEVGNDVARKITTPGALSEYGKKHLLNLGEWNTALLRKSGVLKKNIYVTHYCTACRTDLFHSYRADKKIRGSNVSLIWLTA